eukprot:scaffold66638_cov37-Tisochrysis_lutea.AAC.2
MEGARTRTNHDQSPTQLEEGTEQLRGAELMTHGSHAHNASCATRGRRVNANAKHFTCVLKEYSSSRIFGEAGWLLDELGTDTRNNPRP